jgi:phosphate transport system substrate-binding protein
MDSTIIKGLVASAALAFGLSAHAVDITGAGATFPFPLYAKWADAYKQKTGIGMNYQSIGSGAGIKQIQARTVDFGATDAPLKADELQKAGLVQFPAIIGGVVPIVNLDGVAPGALKLTGAVLADIYLGKIRKWNEKAVVDLNPALKLPDTNITVVRRSDGSGTTFLWTDYLSKSSAEWKDKVGSATAVAWPDGVGGKGNEALSTYALAKHLVRRPEMASLVPYVAGMSRARRPRPHGPNPCRRAQKRRRRGEEGRHPQYAAVPGPADRAAEAVMPR